VAKRGMEGAEKKRLRKKYKLYKRYPRMKNASKQALLPLWPGELLRKKQARIIVNSHLYICVCE